MLLGCSSSSGETGDEPPPASANQALFAAGTQWTTWNPAYEHQFADVNGDGKADLIGIGPNADITVALSTGSSFAPGSFWQRWGQPPDYSIFADVNGDHKADAIAIDGATIRVALSTGSSFGNVMAWQQWPSMAYIQQFADVNGDGKADALALNVFNGEVVVGLNTGSYFGPPTTWAGPASFLNDFFVDVNGDGKTDLVQSDGSTVRVSLSTGSAFALASSNVYLLQPYFDFADVSGDGKADLIGVPSGLALLQVILSTGSGFQSSSTSWPAPPYPFSNNGYTYSFADFNGDAAADVAVFNEGGGPVQVALSQH